MDNKAQLIIIPDEKDYYDVTSNKHKHPELTKVYFDINGIEYNDNTNFNILLVNLNYVVINAFKKDGFNLAIVFVPIGITLKQYQILEDYRKLFADYGAITLGIYADGDTCIFEENYSDDVDNWLDSFYEEIKNRALRGVVTR